MILETTGASVFIVDYIGCSLFL